VDSFPKDFGPFDGRVWLNCAHQGALPRAAVAAAHVALELKISPQRIRDDLFETVPRRLREALGRLIGVPAEEIILGNSASYGLHLLAHGIPWRAGDEVIVVEDDFLANLLPWLGLASRGVRVRAVRPRRGTIHAEELARELGPATKLFCASWVHSFTGYAADLEALGQCCRTAGVRFVLNVSQALGARRLLVAQASVDAITCCGSKWLCGPYATGFCWVRPDFLESLECRQAYWLADRLATELAQVSGAEPRVPRGPRAYDVFGTANFLNFMPWTAAVEYLLDCGIEAVERHDEELVSRLVAGLEERGYALVSPRAGGSRSTLIVASHPRPERNPEIEERLRHRGFDVALRRGNLRFSPHLYNAVEEVDRVLEALEAAVL
jgi:selenocysteine lyase/cysteine desulfurase